MIYCGCAFADECVLCISVHIVHVYVWYFYANRASSVCVCVCAHWSVLAHTDRWGTERLFIFAEEFAL